MNKKEEMISFVESNLRLEGMNITSREKQTMLDCLNGKTTYEQAVRAAIGKYELRRPFA